MCVCVAYQISKTYREIENDPTRKKLTLRKRKRRKKEKERNNLYQESICELKEQSPHRNSDLNIN